MKKLINLALIALFIPLILIGCTKNEITQTQNSSVQENTQSTNFEYESLVKDIIKDYEENKIAFNDDFQAMPEEFVFPSDLENMEFYDNGMGGYQVSITSVNDKSKMIVGINNVLDEKTFEEIPMVVYVFFSVM